jgi:DNA-binding transcriptional ArsR family regulator
MENKNYYKLRAEIFKALAHPTRLFIVQELAKGRKCVCEINEMLDCDVSTLSKHLSVLKNAGILSDEKKGLQVFYSLRLCCVSDFFACVDNLLCRLSDERAECINKEHDER